VIRGMVYLVGAGPGDKGLITIRGLECLNHADVVVYDRLIDRSLLESARPDAELIDVGKSAKCHAREQDEINRILLDRAAKGKVVVRLKGGDPFVLGRGGEEAEALAEHGIPFEVVPGISSATAVPAYAGIPVTHRGAASSFAVVTGHEDPAKDKTAIDWRKLSNAVDTLVCLMGMGNLPGIIDEFIAAGKAPDTPVALIQDGTTPAQKTVVGTLDTIVHLAGQADMRPPVVIVVGEVVRLRDRLNWFERRPLFGKRIAVTRARAQASAMVRLLAERGAEAIELPAIAIQDVGDYSDLDHAISRLQDYQWVLFTSMNGVEAVWDRLRELKLDARHFGNVKIGAIGPATAEALASRGLIPDFVPAQHTSEAIASGLGDIGVRGQRILLPRADIAPEDLHNRLTGLGAEPHEVAAYRVVPDVEAMRRAREILTDGAIDVVAFTSSSTVRNLISAIDGDVRLMDRAVIACIGPMTAATASGMGLKLDILAEEHTIPGLVAAIERYFEKGEA
jgi:uroporphyrinogen III methyltransferase/synthase